MELFIPEYYRKFSCLAANCPDSCCKDWEVDVDPLTAEQYRRLPGTLGDRLRAVLREEDNATLMTITDGRCPMWRKDGLCQIQAELGHEALCKVCREFPRLRHDYGNFVEFGLELSCPEAARLIFEDSGATIVQSVPDGDEPEYDREAMRILRKSREAVLDFLNHTDYPVTETLAILLIYGHEIQNVLDGGDPVKLEPELCLKDAIRYAGHGDINTVLSFFSGLEILTEKWRDRLRAPLPHTNWSHSLPALARYGVQRYWLQAVSDYDLIGRVKFIVIACILVNALGGDPVETAQLFSKEIENNPDNVEAILDGAYNNPALTDVNLLGLLFAP